MADDKPADNQDSQVTQQQIDAAAKMAKAWEPDFKEEDLAIPYKREEKEEDKKDVQKPEEGDKPPAPGTDTPPDAPEVEDIAEPEPVVTVQDPGEYQPADYSFEVILKGGKTITVKTPEDAEALADDPDNFETPKQLMEFITKSNKMQRQLDRDYEKWESQKKQYDEEVNEQTARSQEADKLMNEMMYLVNKGLLPDITDEAAKQRWMNDGNAWQDKELIKTTGIKEQIELLNFMAKENQVRVKAGIQPFSSLLDAFNAWQMDSKHQQQVEADKKQAEEDKAAGEARKAAGSRVAGVSPSDQGMYVPKGIAVGRPIAFRGASQWDD